jgi:hypothetical protein
VISVLERPPASLNGVDGTDHGESPVTLVARTVNVYVTPIDRPMTSQRMSDANAVQPALKGELVTLYEVTNECPEAGLLQATLTEVFAADTFIFIGADGAGISSTEVERLNAPDAVIAPSK